MGILERFGTIMKANINALLDKAEDPSKMIDQYLIDMKESLAEVKKETVNIMAVEKKAAADYGENKAEIEKFKGLAEKAVKAGNDDDARVFIKKYKDLEGRAAGLENNMNVATENATKMKEMHNKLVSDIEALESRKAQVKATVSIAKAVENVNKVGDPMGKASEIGSKFSDMESKANERLNRAQAASELNDGIADAADSLAKSYGAASDSDVDDELAKLKAGL
ncbi:MAG: PspA/IM30 family protein [Clostridiales Family XIII bacterium]|jgi:phage shock protein A|nr:PspA/IM30 family protein [Clostridiales Family XIII bacterium]